MDKETDRKERRLLREIFGLQDKLYSLGVAYMKASGSLLIFSLLIESAGLH
jgi:hypothetical protein